MIIAMPQCNIVARTIVIPYLFDDYKRMSTEEQKEYNVYPKLNVDQVFNVAQTNLKEARPELYAKLEAENKPEKALVKEGDMYSFCVFRSIPVHQFR